MKALRTHLRDYLELRQRLGFKLFTASSLLRNFVRHAEAHKTAFITTKLVLEWATRPPGISQSQKASRLSIARRFAEYVYSVDPRTEIPKQGLIPHQFRRPPPHLYRDEDVVRLIEAAKPAQEGTAGWVKLESGRWTFITKEIYGEFPNWKQVVPETGSTWTRVNLSDEAIKQLVLVTPNLPGHDGLNQPVRLRITDHYLNVEGRNEDDEDWTSIPVDAVVKGRPVTVALNRRYLLNALRFGLNQVEMEDPLNPVVFSNGGRKMVIMPVNLDGPVKVNTSAKPNSGATTPAVEQTTPQEQPGATTEERKDMPRGVKPAETASTGTQTTVAENHNNGNGNGSAIKSLVDHVEQIKENLKNVIRDLSNVIDAVKVAEKEKRTSDKEIDAIRTKLRQIQNVTI